MAQLPVPGATARTSSCPPRSFCGEGSSRRGLLTPEMALMPCESFVEGSDSQTPGASSAQPPLQMMPNVSFVDPDVAQQQCRSTADVRSWLMTDDDSFISPELAKEQKRQRLRSLAQQAAQAAQNMQDLGSLVRQGGHNIDAAADRVAEAAKMVPEGMDDIRRAAKEKVRFLPLQAAGTTATVGGIVGGCVGLVPGAAIGAAIGGAVGAVAGSALKAQAKRDIDTIYNSGRPRPEGPRRCRSADAILTTSFQDDAVQNSGRKSYAFGGITRTLMTRRSWKVKSGRDWGGDGYMPFDVARTIARTLVSTSDSSPTAPNKD